MYIVYIWKVVPFLFRSISDSKSKMGGGIRYNGKLWNTKEYSWSSCMPFDLLWNLSIQFVPQIEKVRKSANLSPTWPKFPLLWQHCISMAMREHRPLIRGWVEVWDSFKTDEKFHQEDGIGLIGYDAVCNIAPEFGNSIYYQPKLFSIWGGGTPPATVKSICLSDGIIISWNPDC